jgi:general secretion pathway protein N
MPIGDIGWDLQLLRLFTGKLSTDLVLSHVAGTVSTGVDYGFGGAITARNLKANVALDRLMLPSLPTSNVRGTVTTDLALLRLKGRVVEAAQGWVQVQGLEQRTGTPLGNYRVVFPGGTQGEPVGAIRDEGGPFAVEGKVRLTKEPGWALDLLVAARPDAPAPMRKQIEFLGSPDAQGRRPLSMSGTY